MLFKTLLMIFLISTSLFSKEIGIYEKDVMAIDLDLKFTNEYNQTKTLREFMDGKPTILTINYFNCPTLCSPLLYEVASVVQRVGLEPGKDFNVITLSIEKNDTFKHAKDTKDKIFKTIKTPFKVNAWNFLSTTNQESIDALTDSVGFKYERRVKDGVVDYLHPAAIIVLTPTGKVARYLNGIKYLPFDLKLAILEATDEKRRPTIANTLLYCFAYDAESKTYIFKAEKIVGGIILLMVVSFFIYLIRTGRRPDIAELQKKREDEKKNEKDNKK
ncbi:MAG: SCO family protein [Campylobacteraceae bacterium]|nr:SCO family protein [Campylobacteraceae bacterium]